MGALHAAATLGLVAVATASFLEAASPDADRASARRRIEARPQPGWSATLVGRDGRKVSGSATARPTSDGKGTEVAVTIDGDTPGATRPWHVHSGSCAQSGGVVGGGRAYTPITIDAKGKGSATATVPTALADTAIYYVNIHDSAAAMSIIVACGDLGRR